MPGGSSAVKEELAKASPPPPLLGALGGAKGSAGPDDHIVGPVIGLRQYHQPLSPLLKEHASRRSTAYWSVSSLPTTDGPSNPMLGWRIC